MAGPASYDADLLAALEALSPNTEAKPRWSVSDDAAALMVEPAG
jgi:hypothetical protein